MQVQSVLHLLPCTYHNDLSSCQTFGIKAVQFVQSLFIFNPSSCSGLWALAEYKPYLSQTSTGKMQWESHLEITWKMCRYGSGPSLKQLPIQEHCHLTADEQWYSLMLETNIWFAYK
jgi:hypothetical protein